MNKLAERAINASAQVEELVKDRNIEQLLPYESELEKMTEDFQNYAHLRNLSEDFIYE